MLFEWRLLYYDSLQWQRWNWAARVVRSLPPPTSTPIGGLLKHFKGANNYNYNNNYVGVSLQLQQQHKQQQQCQNRMQICAVSWIIIIMLITRAVIVYYLCAFDLYAYRHWLPSSRMVTQFVNLTTLSTLSERAHNKLSLAFLIWRISRAAFFTPTQRNDFFFLYKHIVEVITRHSIYGIYRIIIKASYQIGATSGDRYLHTHIHTHVYQYF